MADASPRPHQGDIVPVNELEADYWHCQHGILLGRPCAICTAVCLIAREVHRPEATSTGDTIMPEPPIDPPDDDPECPVCDAILHIATRQLASCGACGWSNEPDWEMRDDQD